MSSKQSRPHPTLRLGPLHLCGWFFPSHCGRSFLETLLPSFGNQDMTHTARMLTEGTGHLTFGSLFNTWYGLKTLPRSTSSTHTGSTSSPHSMAFIATIMRKYQADSFATFMAKAQQNPFPSMPMPRSTPEQSSTLMPAPEAMHLDASLSGHLCNVVDAVTKGPVTEDTTLATLYPFTEPTVDNQLIRDLTHKSSPAARCRLLLEDGGVYPPTMAERAHGYDLYVRFNKLLVAPTVRLECRFCDENGYPGRIVTCEFHFNDCGDVGAMFGFDWSANQENYCDNIDFTSLGATITGFNIARCIEGFYSETRHEVLTALMRLADPGRMTNVKILMIDFKPGVTRILQHLPGGNKALLPALTNQEYAAFSQGQDTPFISMGSAARPLQLMRAGHPMVPLECEDTFTSVKEAVIQLGYSALYADEEASTSIRLWAQSWHFGTLLEVGGLAVVALDFAHFPTLGNRASQMKFRLPSQLSATLHFDHQSSGLRKRCKATLLPDMPGLGAHDAFFVIAGRVAKYFGEGFCSNPFTFDNVTRKLKVKVTPDVNSFLITSQLKAVNELLVPRNARWHAILLNQLHSAIPRIDMAHGVDPAALQRADHFISTFMPWNAEQLQVVQDIRRAKGGMLIVMGPAGTGKTLLQQALAVYFWTLGYHILALAPANSNADHLTRIMARMLKNDTNLEDLRLARLYPSSRDLGHRQFEREGAADAPPEDLELTELRFVLHRLREKQHEKATARDFGIEQVVIDEAENGKLILFQAPPAHLRYLGISVDIWSVFRDCLEYVRSQGQVDDEFLRKYRWSFECCKAHVINETRFIITTTGNVRSSELLENFGKDVNGRVNMQRLVVFVDEACKDTEMNIWSPIVCSDWSDKVHGVVLFGDDKQLKPTNTSSKGDLNFNIFNDRLDLPLPVRLAREGFPVVRLFEQMRMHETIAAMPNELFYDGMLRNGPGTSRTLEELRPGLLNTLMNIIARKIVDTDEGIEFIASWPDEKCRLHYIEVDGVVDIHPRTHSVKVAAHAEAFFRDVYPYLLEHFEDQMQDNVMVICAYSHALHHWQSLANTTAHNRDLSLKYLPRIVTLDSSQGQESFMVIFDGSLQYRDRLGFLTDAGRCNVAITRAQAVFWMIGGKLECKDQRSHYERLSYLPYYRQILWEDGKLHQF